MSHSTVQYYRGRTAGVNLDTSAVGSFAAPKILRVPQVKQPADSDNEDCTSDLSHRQSMSPESISPFSPPTPKSCLDLRYAPHPLSQR